jgi:PKD repeat protein
VPVGTGPNKIAIGNVNPLPVKPESIVDFTSNVTEGYVPLSIQFTDLSKNATAWYWDLGDGTFSTEQHPIHIYSISGTYNVNLTISSENGTFSKTAQINVLEERRSSSGSGGHSSGGKLKSLNSGQNSSAVNNSANNITESTNITKPEDTIHEVEQTNETSTENEALTPEQTSIPGTSESINAKASGFGILFGICCLAAVFLLYRRK